MPLNIAIIGYGRMGRIIEKIANKRGHIIGRIIDQDQQELLSAEGLKGIDVAIEFTHPEQAEHICRSCLQLGVPIVSGTTGWASGLESIREEAIRLKGSFFWSSNYSVGVYLFNHINRLVARMMGVVPDYHLVLTETHHMHKHDAPSGTAITLAEQIMSVRPELKQWSSVTDDVNNMPGDILPINSIRQGEIPGIHSVDYYSNVDKITLTHEAFGREGFALGAVLAAEYAATHQGIHTMDNLIQLNADNL